MKTLINKVLAFATLLIASASFALAQTRTLDKLYKICQTQDLEVILK